MPTRSIITPLENLWYRFGDFLPNFIAAAVLLVIGVAIALGVRFLAVKLLNSIAWEKLSKTSSAFRVLEIGDIRYPLFEMVGAIVFWLVVLVFVGTAAHALGLTVIETLIDRIVGFLPNLFLSLVIIALGIWMGTLAGKFARGFALAAQVREANLLGKGIQYLVILIALGTALEQLQVATRFLFGAFLIVLGSLGLAFGLGGKEKAREIIQRISRAEEDQPPEDPAAGEK